MGYLAAVLTTIAFLPQVVLAWRSDDLSSVSLPMYLFFVTGVTLWLFFGILTDTMPIIVANAITLLLAGSVLVLKIRDIKRKMGSPQGSNEKP